MATQNKNNEILSQFYAARKAGDNPSIDDLPDNLKVAVINNDKASAEFAAKRAEKQAAPNAANEQLKAFYEARRNGENPSVADLPDNLRKTVENNDRISANAKAGKIDPQTANEQLKAFYAARKAGKDPSIEELPEKLQQAVINNDKASAEFAAQRAAKPKIDPQEANEQLRDFYAARKEGKEPSVSDLPDYLQKVVENNDAIAAKAAEGKTSPDDLNAQLHDFYEARNNGEEPSVSDLPDSLQKVVENNDAIAAKAAEDKAAKAAEKARRALADYDEPEGASTEAEVSLGE